MYKKMKREGLTVPAATAKLAPYAALEPVMLEAEPEPLRISLQTTAIIVIDAQNAFLSKGGFLTFDLRLLR